MTVIEVGEKLGVGVAQTRNILKAAQIKPKKIGVAYDVTDEQFRKAEAYHAKHPRRGA